MSAEGRTLKQHYRAAVFATTGGFCWRCSAPATEIDHLWPRRWLGDDRYGNLAPICGPCNKAKADSLPVREFRQEHLYAAREVGCDMAYEMVQRWYWVSLELDRRTQGQAVPSHEADGVARVLAKWFLNVAPPDEVEHFRARLNDEHAERIAQQVVAEAIEAVDQ